jgi:hypothetical protein
MSAGVVAAFRLGHGQGGVMGIAFTEDGHPTRRRSCH